MIERIIRNEKLIAIIIRSSYDKDGIEFFTANDCPQQLGYMKRKKGYHIAAHSHSLVSRNVNSSQEVLFIRAGKVQVSFYDEENNFFQKTIVSTGDVLMLVSGGHGFEMLETSEIIEVKQGPFLNDKLFID